MIRFSFLNLISSIAASSGISPDNITIPTFSKFWKSANPFSDVHSLEATLGVSTVSCLGLFDLNINPNSTLLIQFHLGISIVKTIEIPASQVIYGYGEGPYGIFAYGGYSAPGREWAQRFRVLWLEDIVCDKVSITFSGSNEVSLGYLHVGSSWSPRFGINPDYSATIEPISLDIARSIGGATTGQIARYYRCINVTLQLLESQEVEILMNNVLATNPIVFSAFADKNSTEAIYGTMLGRVVDGVKVVGSPHTRFNAANIKIEECK